MMTISITQIGAARKTVNVTPGVTTIGDALRQAGFNPSGYAITVGGASVSATDTLRTTDTEIVLSTKNSGGNN